MQEATEECGRETNWRTSQPRWEDVHDIHLLFTLGLLLLRAWLQWQESRRATRGNHERAASAVCVASIQIDKFLYKFCLCIAARLWEVVGADGEEIIPPLWKY